jgi:hypothetical protein
MAKYILDKSSSRRTVIKTILFCVENKKASLAEASKTQMMKKIFII